MSNDDPGNHYTPALVMLLCVIAFLGALVLGIQLTHVWSK